MDDIEEDNKIAFWEDIPSKKHLGVYWDCFFIYFFLNK